MIQVAFSSVVYEFQRYMCMIHVVCVCVCVCVYVACGTLRLCVLERLCMFSFERLCSSGCERECLCDPVCTWIKVGVCDLMHI